MYRKYLTQKQTEEQRMAMELATWAWNSHYWFETVPNSGLAICKWCDRHYGNEQGIGNNFPLCKKNPRLKELITEAAGSTGAKDPHPSFEEKPFSKRR